MTAVRRSSAAQRSWRTSGRRRAARVRLVCVLVFLDCVCACARADAGTHPHPPVAVCAQLLLNFANDISGLRDKSMSMCDKSLTALPLRAKSLSLQRSAMLSKLLATSVPVVERTLRCGAACAAPLRLRPRPGEGLPSAASPARDARGLLSRARALGAQPPGTRCARRRAHPTPPAPSSPLLQRDRARTSDVGGERPEACGFQPHKRLGPGRPGERRPLPASLPHCRASTAAQPLLRTAHAPRHAPRAGRRTRGRRRPRRAGGAAGRCAGPLGSRGQAHGRRHARGAQPKLQGHRTARARSLCVGKARPSPPPALFRPHSFIPPHPPRQTLVAEEMASAYGASHVGAVNPVYDTARIEQLVAKCGPPSPPRAAAAASPRCARRAPAGQGRAACTFWPSSMALNGLRAPSAARARQVRQGKGRAD